MEKLGFKNLLRAGWGGGVVSLLRRCLSSAEVSTALRPFYFSVHPDLFGQHPAERTVNEDSLKQLSSYLETLQQDQPSRPQTLTFFLRSQEEQRALAGSFRSVKISLTQRDLRKTVLSILRSCDLPTSYVDGIAARRPAKKSRPKRAEPRYRTTYEDRDTSFDAEQMQQQVNKTKDDQTLGEWLERNAAEARGKLEASRPVREEVERLEQALVHGLGVRAVLGDCGWNAAHFRGCLISFQSLARHHPEVMHVLRGRTLMFSSDTGVSLDGHVMLNSGEVRNNWLDLLKNVHAQDSVLRRIPAFERAVSTVLRDIQIVRRKFQPKVMAESYEKHLRRMVTSLSDYQGRRGYPGHWPQSLARYELVVETEAGPLMLSPTGQFIVPASCPAFLLVAFVSSHLDEAARLLQHYQDTKHVERSAHAECVSAFGLAALLKEDNVTPDLMIACCRRLLAHRGQLEGHLRGARLRVASYYCVLADGDVCLPWDWRP
ncbi:T-cell activation inhibitor, mitochondrial [Bacillus rossius redtenbacheri]|uniref:T-cell activation inhibitor, mitochondrial n=1 Tax=Bacillus rossius redtenbacheri TaxID=93214 RepID=UPI002FDE40D2